MLNLFAKLILLSPFCCFAKKESRLTRRRTKPSHRRRRNRVRRGREGAGPGSSPPAGLRSRRSTTRTGRARRRTASPGWGGCRPGPSG